MKTNAWMRFLLVFLSAVMVLSLFACGKTPEDTTAESKTETTEKKTTEATEPDEKTSEPDKVVTTEPDTVVTTEGATDGTTETESESETDQTTTETGSETSESESTAAETTEAETDEGETTTEAETDPVIETVETEKGVDIVSFVDYISAPARETYDLKSGAAAVAFTVPADNCLKEFYLNLTNEIDYTACDITVNIYRFNGDYKESVSTEAIYTQVIKSTLKTTTITFEDELLGAGDYILVVSVADNAAGYTSVMFDNFWTPRSIPEQYKKYAMRSFINGREKNHTVMCCAMAIDGTIPVIKSVEDATPNTSKDGENVAKVILLAGQSNAAGVSQVSILQKKIGAEEFAKYQNGFPNVKILYKNGNQDTMMNSNFEFVDVKLGQGIDSGAFGPEIGLAAYLSEAYPDETFYIIKYGVGGTNLFAHWNAVDSTRNKHLTGFKNSIEEGIGMLKEDGLDPKIVGWLWMQGESDATQFYHAHEYYNRQKALVEDIRTTFAEYASASGIKFIDAATSSSGYFASWFLVNDMKLKYSKENLDNYYIDTISYGLTTLNENNDLAHYDSMSMLILGRLFGDKLAYALEGDKDDGICPHKESALKADKDVHYTECEICKVKMTSAAHVPTGALEYDAESKSYKGACACGAFGYNDLYFTTEARVSSGACEDVANSTGSEDGEAYFVRYTPTTANKRARVYLIFQNQNVTGQYMVLKYRLVNNGQNSEFKDTFAATTETSNPMARGNGDACGSFGTLIGDGEWHYMVVDLAAKNAAANAAGADLQFKANADGKYACTYIRADFLTAAQDGSCYLDIASIGFADQYDAVSKFTDACPHIEYSEIVYDAATKSYKRACTRCGEAIYQELLISLEGRTSTGACENVTVTTGTEDGEDYVRYTQSADKRIQFYPIHGNKTVTGQYMILKYRLVNNNTNSDLTAVHAATTASANPMARGNGDECGVIGTLIGDGEWHYLVVDLAAKNKENGKADAELQFKADENGKYACSYIRANILLQAYDGSCYLDIASIGFADQKDVADKFSNS